MWIHALICLMAIFWGSYAMAFPIDTNNLIFAQPEEVGMSTDKLEKLDEVIMRHVNDRSIQGAVVAISRRGKPVYFAAHGLANPYSNQPMKLENMFVMQSSTKPVTGVAAMIAVERGLFNPEDEVSEYIPAFKDIEVAVLDRPRNRNISPDYVWTTSSAEPGFLKRMAGEIMAWFSNGYLFHVPKHRSVPVDRPVTIHDLLTHTAGLGTYGLGQATSDWGAEMWDKSTFIRGKHTLESYINMVAAGPLDFQPGSRWMYSGTIGLDVVARIIEITSGQSFNEFVTENIFDPLDMKDTYWWSEVPFEKEPRLVVRAKDKGKDKNFTPAVMEKAKESRYFSGSVGLVSTARDYLHFEQMLVNGGTLLGNRVLKKSSVELMSANHVGDLFGKTGKGKHGGEGFGYTVSVTLKPELAMMPRSKGAFGWAGAFGTISWTEPETQTAVVVMVQQPSKDFGKDIAGAVSGALID